MKLLLLPCMAVLLWFSKTSAQSLAINTTGATADNSSILDISSTTKGLLIPRMSSANRFSILTPSKGLIVYDTTTNSIWFYDGTQWMDFIKSNDKFWSKIGNHIYNTNSINVGIGNPFPVAKFQVTDNSVLFNAQFGPALTSPADPPLSGPGRRMLWYVDKAAFRTGYITGNNWDKDSIGNYSFASGSDSKAKGEYSVAMGWNNNVTGQGSAAIGVFNTTSGIYGALSTGFGTTASGNASFTAGSGSIASADGAAAFGNFAQATGSVSFSAGQSTLASGHTSVAFGNGVQSTGQYASGFGSNNTSSGNTSFTANSGNIASGFGSAAMGISNIAKARNGFSIGTFNEDSDSPDPSVEAPDDRIFQVGNGFFNVGFPIRKNAFTVLRNGNVGINISNPAFPLNLDGNFGDKISLVGTGTFHYGIGARVGLMMLHSDINTSDIAFGWGGNSAFTERARVINNGELAMTLQGRMQVNTGSQTAGIWFNNTSNTSVNGFVGMLSDNYVGFYGSNGAGWGMNMNTINGNLGIGTTNPAKKTEIVGPASAIPVTLVIGNRGGFGPAAMEFVSDYGLGSQWRPGYIRNNDLGGFTGSLEFYTNGSGAGNLYGNVKGLEVRNGVTYTATGTVSSFSDERLKKDIRPFEDGLNIITRINPVSFSYNEAAPFITSKEQVGVIAQELEKIAPYMVERSNTKEMDDMRSVNNQAYIFLLINAVKEQQKQIEELRKEVARLRK